MFNPSDIKKLRSGYLNALISGYLLMGTLMIMQFLLTPLYLKHLGENQFGMLMILLNMVNFAAIGIGWMSGGFVRIVGEFWTSRDVQGVRDTFCVSKYVYTLYAIFIVSAAVLCWWLHQIVTNSQTLLLGTVLAAGFYFILNYEALPERQAFVGINHQATGNYIEFARTLLFGGLTFLLLPRFENINVVWLSLIAGVAVQRAATGVYWANRIGGLGWRKFSPGMKPIFKRLTGRQGLGYMAYGILILTLQADTMLIGFIGGAEAAGKFVLLWKIPEAIGLLLWRIPSTVEPRVIALDASGRSREWYTMFTRGRRWFGLIVLAASLLYMAMGQWIARLWVGNFAPDAGWMYIAGGVALFFNTFARWPISFAYALIRLRRLVKVAVIEVACKFILMVILFPHLEIAAPLVASILVHLVYAAWAYHRIIDKGEPPDAPPPNTPQQNNA